MTGRPRALAALVLAALALGAGGCGGDSPADELRDAEEEVRDAERRVDLLECEGYAMPSERQACRDEVNAR